MNTNINLANFTGNIFQCPLPSLCELSYVYCNDCYNDLGICCEDGEFKNPTGICESCDISCSTCFGSSSSECSSCNDGYYGDGSTCSPCDETCLTCSGPTTCTSCSSPNPNLQNGVCEDCPDGQFDTGFDMCEDCDDNCSTCSTFPTTCTSCSSPIPFLNMGSCEECPDGQFDTGFDTCANCDISCSTCFGSSSSECSSCNDGYYGDGSTCSPCDETCLTCSGPTTCTSCSSPNPNLQNGVCGECPDGQFDTGFDTCEDCGSDCLTCSGSSSTCTSCYPGNILTRRNTCVLDYDQMPIFKSPTSSTKWSLYQQGCIQWFDSFRNFDIRFVKIEYGPSFSLSVLIADNVDLTSGQLQWRISSIYPGTARVVFIQSNGPNLYSDSFEVYPPSRRYNDSC